MRVLFVTGEVAPFSKSGGLGDVAYALPKELAKQGIDVRVVSPFYTHINEQYKEQMTDIVSFTVKVCGKDRYVGVKTLTLNHVVYYFIDNLDYFNRGHLYGDWDDGERFGYFCLAVIEMLEKIPFIPDVLHVNDWHTAMIPALLIDKYHWVESFKAIKKVLTIHNLKFQGVYDPIILDSVFHTSHAILTEDGGKYFDCVNFLKAGINFSDCVTTVSPTYANEIMTSAFGEGLNHVLQYNAWKVKGILNGIDYDLNNPESDQYIPYHFTIDNLDNKAKNKAALQENLGLPIRADVPIISCVSRLTDQKGFQLIAEKIEELLAQDVQVVILGTGDAIFEEYFTTLAKAYPNKLKACITFDIALAQLIYAGSDLFLMPSAFEPCGLSQLMALRYGTLPIVHETGGLKDTVIPYNQFTGEGTGFSFQTFDSDIMMHVIYQALDVYYNAPKQWIQLVKQAMNAKFDWEKPALDYMNTYKEITERK
ncbi:MULTISPECIES: glycogen synthase GlgA [unclassified Granulicatella]|uniref:glycogen synthase GlgA n=1 Tax=unclassified Granulicatella TaxID=2630493 RepID=UPI0010746137|nr:MULTISPECIES: glycogen synthase GlgA [unclassified Granulicatella]MBF0780627.1 glycogen synthase GlgA [Granulicatella sp. 19428wC4_WM01]TFU94585.1 glycogen synthase GlgA [Granulicatella sp. WM01]